MPKISDPTNLAIISEVYKAAERLGADTGLLCCIGSWGDTLDDAEILSMLKSWNEMGEPFIPETTSADSEVVAWLKEQGATEGTSFDEDTGRPMRTFKIYLNK